MTPPPPELAAAILADPDADAPRLALADWLDENGDPEWAELIRVQIALARPDPMWSHGRLQNARGREDELARVMLCRLSERAGTPAGAFSDALWRRGLPVRLTWPTLPDAGFWELSASLFVLEELTAPVTVEDIARLSALCRLQRVFLTVDRSEPLTWAEAEPLAALPLLRVAQVTGSGGGDLLADVRDRLWAERDRRHAPLGPADRLAALRSLGEPVHVSASGDVWACGHGVSDWRDGLLAGLPNLRGLNLTGESLPPALARLSGLRSLVAHHARDGGAIPESLADLREVCRPVPADGGAALREWAARPRSRVLVLPFGDDAPVAPPAEAALRVLHVPATAWLGPPAPGVVELRAHAGALPTPATVRAAFPDLRTWCPDCRDLTPADVRAFGEAGIFLAPRTESTPEDAPPPAAWLDWPRMDVSPGVSLAVPLWFARLPTPAPDPRFPDLEPLAAWREWGELDGSDDDLVYGPVRVRLERLHRRVKATERKAVLLEPATSFPVAQSRAMREGTSPAGKFYSLRTGDWCARACWRFLWPRKAEALRLVIDFAGYRRAGFEAWLPRVADSLEWA